MKAVKVLEGLPNYESREILQTRLNDLLPDGSISFNADTKEFVLRGTATLDKVWRDVCGTQNVVPHGFARSTTEAPRFPEMEAVNKVVGPGAPQSLSSAPPPEPQLDQPSSSSSDELDSGQATVLKAALFRLFADVTSGVPDWTDFCESLPLLPNRASQKRDYETLKSLRDKQARYMDLLSKIKERYYHLATELDLSDTKKLLRQESQKLSLLECRLEIYTTILDHTAQVAFNEIQWATDHTSRNDSKAIRTIVTFKQAALLVQSISLTQILNKEKLIVDISRIRPWNYSEKCYLMLDVFCLSSGTVHVMKRRFCTRYVQIKYFEASWPEALVAHRIQPLPGSMRAITKIIYFEPSPP